MSLLLLLLGLLILMSEVSQIDRAALVTGGTRGIGRGIATRLAETGEYAALLLTYNTNRTAAESFVKELQEQHPDLKIELVGGDISLEKTRDKIFHTLDKKLSDCVVATTVHNAGQYVGITAENVAGLSSEELVFGDGSLLKKDDKPVLKTMHYYQKMYGDAWVDLCERSLDRMRKAGVKRGCLIGISSPGCNAMQCPGPSYSMPGSGKCVMEYSMRIYAVKSAPMGVNCNVIIPGVTRTEAWHRLAEKRGMDKEAIIKKARERIPMGEEIDPKDIGDVVAFLSKTTGGGRFITGQSILVDGGITMKF